MPKESVPPDKIGALAREAALAADAKVKDKAQQTIRELTSKQGVFLSSIQGLYEAAGKGLYSGITVPAINIRGITYDVARAVFRAALRNDVGAFIFEIARSETGYTGQRPGEYAACVLAAARRPGGSSSERALGGCGRRCPAERCLSPGLAGLDAGARRCVV